MIFPRLNRHHWHEQLTGWWTTSRTALLGVAVGDGERVWVLATGNARVTSDAAFRRTYADALMGECDIDGDVDLDELPTGVRSTWRPFVSWLTQGVVESDGCVGVARTALLRAGYPVPRRITTPLALLRWLFESGSEPRRIRLLRGPSVGPQAL